MNRLKRSVYLAGGFGGDWHSTAMESLIEDFYVFDPKQHEIEDPNKYTQWDLFHISKCDILLGYMAEDNPSGYGLALEIGYAKANNKLVILVDRKSEKDELFRKYFAMCHQSADLVFSSLNEALQYIRLFQ